MDKQKLLRSKLLAFPCPFVDFACIKVELADPMAGLAASTEVARM